MIILIEDILNGVFLFNQFHSNLVNNTYAASLLKNWLGFEMAGKKDSINMLNPVFQRNLNDEEMAAFDFDFN